MGSAHDRGLVRDEPPRRVGLERHDLRLPRCAGRRRAQRVGALERGVADRRAEAGRGDVPRPGPGLDAGLVRPSTSPGSIDACSGRVEPGRARDGGPGRRHLGGDGADLDGTALEYKYTRGAWEHVEWWGSITSTANRHVTISYGTDGTQLVDNTSTDWGTGSRRGQGGRVLARPARGLGVGLGVVGRRHLRARRPAGAGRLLDVDRGGVGRLAGRRLRC